MSERTLDEIFIYYFLNWWLNLIDKIYNLESYSFDEGIELFMFEYTGFIPPCGIYCGICPNYIRDKNICLGATEHCKKRKCKGIYICCIEKKGYSHCYECSSFPCSRFKKFAESWIKIGQDLIENQKQLKEYGEKDWLLRWNKRKET